MIKRFGQRWGGARIVAWTIVYALVFQVAQTSAFQTSAFQTSAFQTSAFLASRAPGPAPGLFHICQNDPSAAEPHAWGYPVAGYGRSLNTRVTVSF